MIGRIAKRLIYGGRMPETIIRIAKIRVESGRICKEAERRYEIQAVELPKKAEWGKRRCKRFAITV